jgi:hypothetical protein
MPRLQILTASEHQDFETPPRFSAAERATFFQLSAGLSRLLETLRTPTNRGCLLLTVGYFRATKRCLPPPLRPGRCGV